VNPVDRVTPLARASAAITATGVEAVVKPIAATIAAVPSVEAMSTGRNPNRLISGVVAGLIPTFPAKTNAATAPDLIGDQPYWTWNSSGSRNGIEPTTTMYREPPACDTRNVGTLRVRRLSSGWAARRRCTTAPASSAADAAAARAAPAAGGEGSVTR